MSGLTAQQVAELRDRLIEAVAQLDGMVRDREGRFEYDAANLLRWKAKGLLLARQWLDEMTREQ